MQEGIHALETIAEKTKDIFDGHPDKAMTMSNIASLCLIRYQRLGHEEDLDDAIKGELSAVQADPSAGFLLGERQSNLAHMLQVRSLHTGSLDDLHHALSVSEHALDSFKLLQKRHPRRALVLSNYGNQYESLYERTGNPKHLKLAIERTKQALDEIQNGDLRGLAIMDNLANKFNLLGGPEALQNAILLGRSAVAGTFSHKSNLACRLHNLSNHLADLYRETHELPLLVEAIAKAEEAVGLTPKKHPVRATRLQALAMKQKLWYESSKDKSAIGHARDNLLEAWKMDSAMPLHRVRAGASLLRLFCRCKDYDRALAAAVADGLLNLLPAVHTRSLRLRDRKDVMSEFAGVAANACAIFLEQGQADRALECLEQGRAVMIGDVVDELDGLGRLGRDHGKLKDFVRLRKMLNASGPDDDDDDIDDQKKNDDDDNDRRYDRIAAHRRDALNEFMDCIKRIREEPGYERFMDRQTLPEMQACAAGGHIIVVNVTELRSDAILVSPQKIEALHLPQMSAAEARDWLKHNWLDDKNEFGLMNRRYCDYLSQLWDKCVHPIFKQLGFFPPTIAPTPAGVGEEPTLPPRVWWIGSALASSMPFHAAGHYRVKTVSRNAIECATSSYTPSIKALRRSQARAQGGGSPTAPLWAIGRSSSDFLVVAMPETPQLEPLDVLPKVMVDAMLNATKKDSSSSDLQILQGPDACCARNVLAQLEDDTSLATVVHFGCHGITDQKDPWRSHLVLHRRDGASSSSSATLVQDLLTVEDLVRANSGNSNSHPQVRLAYLSACSTAKNSAPRLADEVIHLASGFQVAGFAHVIACLWNTLDDVAGKVAAAFYESLLGRAQRDTTALALQGRAVADALRKSIKAQFQENDRFKTQPLKWAQFVHYGA